MAGSSATLNPNADIGPPPSWRGPTVIWGSDDGVTIGADRGGAGGRCSTERTTPTMPATPTSAISMAALAHLPPDRLGGSSAMPSRNDASPPAVGGDCSLRCLTPEFDATEDAGGVV